MTLMSAAIPDSARALSKSSTGYSAHSVSSSPRAFAINWSASLSNTVAMTGRGMALQSTRIATSALNSSLDISCRVPDRDALRAA